MQVYRSARRAAVPWLLALAATAAAAPTAATWFMGATTIDLPKCTQCEVTLPPSGDGSMGAFGNPANTQLSPGVPIMATKLSVHVDTPPGGTATRRFLLFVRSDPAHSLSCDIKGAQTSCSSGTRTLAVPAASLLIIDAANIGNAAATRAEFSWAAIPQ